MQLWNVILVILKAKFTVLFILDNLLDLPELKYDNIGLPQFKKMYINSINNNLVLAVYYTHL